MSKMRIALVEVLLCAGLATGPIATVAQAFTVVAGPTIAGGVSHSLALRGDGSVWAFGRNEFGQLGTTTNNGANSPVPTPTRVPGLTGVVAVAAGDDHSVILRSDGTVWAFGDNLVGQLGTSVNVGTNAPNPSPRSVPGLGGVIAIAAAGRHSLALRSDGTVWAFGANVYGELGTTTNNGVFTANSTPSKIPGLDAVIAIATSTNHSLALRGDGTVWAFGLNRFGQLGTTTNNDTLNANPTPWVVPGLNQVVAVAASYSHSLALRRDGTVWAFGDNTFGGLGNAANTGGASANPTPVLVAGLTDVTAIAAGGGFSLALREDRTVWGFGVNSAGQLGTTTNINTGIANPTPTQVPSLGDVVAVVATDWHSMALRGDGTVWSFGLNLDGQLGTTTNLGTIVANPIPALASTAAVTQFASRFVPVAPTRLIDTRPGSAINYTGGRPGAGSLTVVPVIGRAGIPIGATAVVGNLTVTEAAATGFVQVLPTAGGIIGASSNVNVERVGQTISNSVVVPIGADGTISVYTQSGGHVLFDVAGYYTPAPGPTASGRLVAFTPNRILDTRLATAIHYVGAKPAARSATRVQVSGVGSVPLTGVAAVVVNVTATGSTAAGFIQVAPAGGLVAGTSSILNIERAGQTIANQVVVPLGNGGGIDLYTQSGTDLIVDVAAYFTDGTATPGTSGLFIPVVPTRTLDTRPESFNGYVGAKPASGAFVRVDYIINGVVPAVGISAVVTNVTITQATAAGFVQAAAPGTLAPGASSMINADRSNQTIANTAIVPTGDGRFDLYTQSGGHLLADVFGWYTD